MIFSMYCLEPKFSAEDPFICCSTDMGKVLRDLVEFEQWLVSQGESLTFHAFQWELFRFTWRNQIMKCYFDKRGNWTWCKDAWKPWARFRKAGKWS